MTAIRKMRLYQILLIILAITLSNCMSDDYNLKNGVNTDVSVGGDSLTIPLGKTQKTFLGTLLDKQSIDILKKSQSGAYLLQLKDSLGVKLDSISPVNFSIAPITITPINTTIASVTIPTFQINPINLSSSLPIPTVDLSKFSLPAIDSAYVYSKPISGGSGTRQLTKSNSEFSIGPLKIQASNQINQSILFNFSNASTALQRVNVIHMSNNTVTITFDKTQINQLGFDSQNDTIYSFQMTFPSNYILTSNVGTGTSISGSTFMIQKAVLSSTQNVYTASFKIDRLDMSTYPEPGILSYSNNITSTIDYRFSGTSSNASLLTKNIQANLHIKASPTISDMDIQTTDFGIVVPSGSNQISQSISIPKEVSKVNTLTFDAGANLSLNIADPGISPFSFNGGNCIIQLPKKFIFKAFTGLDLTTNILTIPYSQLFGIKNIGITGMNINQSVPTGTNAITLVDNLSYNIQGLDVASQVTSVSVINAMSNKTMNITGTITGLSVNNASVVTNSITFNIPNQTNNININQFVSNDVKTIYDFTLKTPSILQFKINISNMPTGIDSVFFSNYTIQFPTFLKFKTGDVNTLNQLVLNEGFKVANGFTKSLTIQKIDFGANGISMVNGALVINQAVTMTGNAYVKGANLNSKDISTIVISPSVTIGTMSIGQIDGNITTTIQPVSQSVSLNLPSFLTGGTSVLDIVNPVMTFQIGNTMGIPVNLNLTLTPVKNGVVQTAGVITTNIAIAPATVLGQSTWSNYWISNSCKGYSAGYDTINVALQKLLRSVPDQIKISAIPTITGTRQSVDLYSLKNQMDMKYAVNVPLSFGQDFVLQYIDTVGDLQKNLKDILKYARQVDILISVDNTIPLELTMSATALTTARSVIDGITISTPDKIKSGNADGTPQTTKIIISLRETKTGALDSFDALKLMITAKNTSTVAGISLNANQYITLDMKVRIPKGLTITSNSTK
jgi:hypothetical protein